MSTPVSRRFALFRIGSVAAAAATAPAAVTAATPAVATGPLTPDQYIRELATVSHRIVAGFHYKADGAIHRMGCFEYGPDPKVPVSDAEARRVRDGFTAIRRRSGWHDRAWSDAVWERLWELGRREDLRPLKKSVQS
jgi:hypothetical protein